jgi:hypothetical protein
VRGLIALLVVAIPLGVVSEASAGMTRAGEPSLGDCVSAWNASPGLKGVAATRAVHVDALRTSTSAGTIAWDAGASVSLRGPGCAVWVRRSPGHVLVVYLPWKGSGPLPWRKPVTLSGLPDGNRFNAALGATDRLVLR